MLSHSPIDGGLIDRLGKRHGASDSEYSGSDGRHGFAFEFGTSRLVQFRAQFGRS